MPAALPLLMEAPHGDEHPVLLLPGFMTGEATLGVLKLFLKNKGYSVHTWGLGVNIGFRSKHVDALPQIIRYLHHTTGQKVSLVGWSLGGVFAFYGALSAPECVRSIITLGSPVSVDSSGNQSPPTSCLYSLTDGVVPPQEATIDGDPALHENIRVPGSHVGLVINGIVMAIIANRLAEPEGQWKPFDPQGLLGRVWHMTSG